MNAKEIREAPEIYGRTRVGPQFGGSAAVVLPGKVPFGIAENARWSKRILPVSRLCTPPFAEAKLLRRRGSHSIRTPSLKIFIAELELSFLKSCAPMRHNVTSTKQV